MTTGPYWEDYPLPCLYEKADALDYAFTVPLKTVVTQQPQLPPAYGETPPKQITLSRIATTPLTMLVRQPDNITLFVPPDSKTTRVVTVQERAYPGWWVTVDGQPAKLESVGGWIGVVLRAGTEPHIIYFEFRPPLVVLSLIITLMTALFCAAYLLNADQIIRRFRVSGHG
jgi:hypothetical protein